MGQVADRVLAVIPARYSSSRFPGKALAQLAGEPLIAHVYRRVCRVEGVQQVLIATDDERIAEAANRMGANCVLSTRPHPCGSDRVAEAALQVDAQIVVNVQGDQPLLDPATVAATIAALRQDPLAEMATPHTRCRSTEELRDPNVVCVVGNSAGYALYFSRAPIPFSWAGDAPAQRHLGIYAFRRAALARFASLPQSPLELAEGLEQLRALEAGFHIRLVAVPGAPTAVDTPEQLAHVARLLKEQRDEGD